MVVVSGSRSIVGASYLDSPMVDIYAAAWERLLWMFRFRDEISTCDSRASEDWRRRRARCIC
jgi:hypothetical protein